MRKEELKKLLKELEDSHKSTQESILTLQGKLQQMINSNSNIQMIQRQINELAVGANSNLGGQEMLRKLIAIMEEEEDPKKKPKSKKK